MREQALNDARTLVYKTNAGVMSTISNNLRGYPFGSVTPYMCDEQGRVYFFISDIAQHTKNHGCIVIRMRVYVQFHGVHLL